MTTATREFEIPAPRERVWELMSNPVELGECISGCEGVTIVSSTESRWKVKVTVGVMSRRVEAKARILEMKEPEQMTIQLESLAGDLSARFTVLLGGQDQSTKVRFSADVEARGSFQWIVNQVIKGQIDKLVGEFATCVSAKLKST